MNDRRFAFVEFESAEAVQAVLAGAPYTLKGQEITVEVSRIAAHADAFLSLFCFQANCLQPARTHRNARPVQANHARWEDYDLRPPSRTVSSADIDLLSFLFLNSMPALETEKGLCRDAWPPPQSLKIRFISQVRILRSLLPFFVF
jgi:hypothetical protein